MTDIEKRAESVAIFKKFGEGMDEKDVVLNNILIQGRREGYIKGATEQRKIDIDKACEYLHKEYQQMNILIQAVCDRNIGDLINVDASIKSFRKAMEEE